MLGTLAEALAGIVVAAQAVAYGASSHEALVRPPGSPNNEDFLARCIRCGKCVQACPYEAISLKRDLLSEDSGTPFIDVRAKSCRMCEDFPCVEVCPTDALRNCSSRDDVNMGTAVINEDTCIAFRGMRCEVCYRTCPLIDRAITIDFRAREGDAIHTIFAPVIHEDVCTGCGLCVERCVTDEPAITIDASRGRREQRRNRKRGNSGE